MITKKGGNRLTNESNIMPLIYELNANTFCFYWIKVAKDCTFHMLKGLEKKINLFPCGFG